MPVLDGLQELGTALGIQLGQRITGEVAASRARELRGRAENAEAGLGRVRAMAKHWLVLSGTAIDAEVKEWTSAAGRSVLEALDSES